MFFKRIWGYYLKSLEKFPLITKAITAGALFGGGDVVAQLIEKSVIQHWKFTFQ